MDEKIAWGIDTEAIKKTVCRCIDNHDWLNARRLMEAVEMIVEKHKVLRDAVQR